MRVSKDEAEKKLDVLAPLIWIAALSACEAAHGLTGIKGKAPLPRNQMRGVIEAGVGEIECVICLTG